nr:hypothetical protein [Candidatus Cloacimonadota bacterium]
MNKIAILFTTNRPDTVGSDIILSLMIWVSLKFNTTIVTNQPKLVSKEIPNCKVIHLKKYNAIKVPFIREVVSWISTARQINELNVNLCFLLHEMSAIVNWLKCPSAVYVHQFGSRSMGKPHIIKCVAKSLLNLFCDKFFYQGLVKTDLIFVASPQIQGFLRDRKINDTCLLTHAYDLTKYRRPLIVAEHNKLKELKERGYFILAYTGWVTESRGFPLILEAAYHAIMRGKNIALVIAGSEKTYSRIIHKYVHDNNIVDNVLDMGTIDSSLVPGILFYADACISLLDPCVPAYHLSPPQKVIQYFAAGKPVICNHVSTHDSLVNDGETGLITEYDIGSVSDAICRLYDDVQLCSQISARALQESEKYEIGMVFDNVIQKMNDLIETRNDYNMDIRK